MVDIPADEELESREVHRTAAWRALAILLLVGIFSFVAFDQLMLQLKTPDPPDEQGRPFIVGVSAIGGPDASAAASPIPPIVGLCRESRRTA
jgi:hypothetical protein